MKNHIYKIILLVWSLSYSFAGETMPLAGFWDFRMDSEKQGFEKHWWKEKFPDKIKLPGYLQAQGFGEKPGPQTRFVLSGRFEAGASVEKDNVYDQYRSVENYKSSEIMEPLRHYIGPAWYARDFEIPKDWQGKRVHLELERCHWGTQVWIDDQAAGSADSLGAPHVYDLTSFLSPGRHRITIRVTNEMLVSIGRNAHSISDQTQTTWNGILGNIALHATDPVWIEDIQVFPNIKEKNATVRLTVGNKTGKAGQAILSLDALGYNAGNTHDPANSQHQISFSKDAITQVELSYSLGEGIKLWDEFSPALYRLNVSLISGEYKHDVSTSFGMRELGIDGKHFTINGHKIFLRGNVDCAIFPFMGHPPLDVDFWRKVWQVHKDFGLNHVRFHSWCPPAAAFTAADEIGLYLAPEVSEWADIEDSSQEQFFKRESAAMLREYGNSPSFTMMSLGNERRGEKEILTRLILEWKKNDPRHFYACKANSSTNPPIAEFEIVNRIGAKRVRYQKGWPPRPNGSVFVTEAPQTTIDWRDALKQPSKPIFSHETAQICSYPEVEAMIAKFTGFMRPTYLEIARDQLIERGMLDQVPAFVESSGRWQIELTKEEMEAQFRTPGLAGFQWLSLNDFPGQGIAPVGFTDYAWTPKPYVDATSIRNFIAPTVPLARLKKRVWSDAEPFQAKIEIAHWGQKSMVISDLIATVTDESGKELFRQELPEKQFELANAQSAGEMKIPAGRFTPAAKYTLHVKSSSAKIQNHWDFWVFSEKLSLESPGDVVVTQHFDAKTRKLLAQGAKVLLLPSKESLKGKLPMCFLNHYWTSFDRFGGSSSASGLVLDPKHPVFNHFPTDPHVNWQWWDLLTRARPMILDIWDEPHAWPKKYRPLIQPVDTWKLNRKLAVLAEAKIGPGKLMICSMDIQSDLENRLVARQFRHSLIRYMKSEQFAPLSEVSEAMVNSIFLTMPLSGSGVDRP